MSPNKRTDLGDSTRVQIVNNAFAPVTSYVTTGLFFSPCWQGEAGNTTGDPLVYCNGDEYLSVVDLASRFGLDSEQLRKRLDRWRKKSLSRFVEDEERRVGASRYLYRLKDVAHLITALKDKRNVQRQLSQKTNRA